MNARVGDDDDDDDARTPTAIRFSFAQLRLVLSQLFDVRRAGRARVAAALTARQQSAESRRLFAYLTINLCFMCVELLVRLARARARAGCLVERMTRPATVAPRSTAGGPTVLV